MQGVTVAMHLLRLHFAHMIEVAELVAAVGRSGRVGSEGWRIGEDRGSGGARTRTWDCVRVSGAAGLAGGVWVLDG
jgi:hypothetical protein